MKELISRQVVLAEVREWLDQRGIDGAHLVAVLEQIPSEGGWISVEERTPETLRDVLLFVRLGPERFIQMGWFIECEWHDREGNIYGEVTHWMPLPVAPKEDTHEQ